MRHLEQLIFEYYDWQGYLVKNNIKVGKRTRGGWEMELDIVAYHPETNHVVHIEASLDADAWDIRQKRFEKKFSIARRYIFKDIFKWVDDSLIIEQYAILTTHPKGRNDLSGGKIKSIDEFANEISEKIKSMGLLSKNAISESYPLLRTFQLILNGFYSKKK